MYVYVCTCMYICVRMYVYIRVCMFMCVCVCIYVYVGMFEHNPLEDDWGNIYDHKMQISAIQRTELLTTAALTTERC